MSKANKTGNESRRDFLKTTAVAGAALAGGLLLEQNAHAGGSDTIKVGLIGCGGRGTDAATNALSAAKGVTLHAIGDAFKFQADNCRNNLDNWIKGDGKGTGNSVDVENRVFDGLDAYKKVLDSGVDYVILATPPGFRPLHIEATVAKGKTLFTEKPVGVDGPGLRKVFKAYEDAQSKGLAIAAGTQRRHQAPYIDTIKAIHDGAIGDIVSGRVFWNQGILWSRDPKPGMTTDVQKQMWNWYNYTWVCGDHIVEQHVHNLDVANWAIGTHPESAVGMGFRTRNDPRYGHIYDFFAIDYAYPKNVHVLSMCRQISECANEIGEHIYGTKGYCHVNGYTINGKRVAKKDGINPYVQEHTDLIESLRSGKPINELKNVAESTLTAILGRMSAYSGKRVTWEEALKSEEQLMPDNLTWETERPAWHVAVPGHSDVFGHRLS
jgi:predicted dehydrogenase